MGIIIKLIDPKTAKEYYLDWSTICDAPLTFGLSKKEFEKYYQKEYGRHGMQSLPERMRMVECKGCSSHLDTLDFILKHNRAGKNETCIDKEEILENYCRNRKQIA